MPTLSTARLWLGLAALCAACEDKPTVIVSLAPLPADAAHLSVSLTYRGQMARAPAPIEFDLTGQDLAQPATFAVRMPPYTNGDLVIGAGVLDRGGCLSAFGTGTAASVKEGPQIDVALNRADATMLTEEERCQQPDSTPLLLSVSPALLSSRGGDLVTVRGWGFVDGSGCSAVSIGGQPGGSVSCPSLVELRFTAPQSQGVVGKVPLQVVNRNGRKALSGGLLTYYAETIRFGGAVSYPVGNAPSAIAAGRIFGDARPDLAVTNRDDGTVTVLLNGGQGDFPAARSTTLPVGVRPSAVAIGDLSLDGHADLLVANAADHTVSKIVQDLPMVPPQFTAPVQTYVNLLPSAVAIGDLCVDSARL